ncbi:MAG: selenocysteine-specific translation elongation factor, partial [Oscillospiraceae bacterium]|nr:selenocysteine-specific translation elongation factor [Oscillospiraceae bacterium]
MKHIVIGTAGHVDHGKTSLTRALTGVDTDRLREEQKRGITIEIGFAELTLPNGQTASIVDVPGHEKLVGNMLAGASGMDVVLMVVAADEGVMPQTREHLGILTLLGVRRGIVVMTKCDMVEQEWLEAMCEETRGKLKETFLAEAPMVCVSSRTGEGLDALKEEIVRLVDGAEERSKNRPFRLPVDRVFTIDGFGTVVTGTLAEGEIRAGDEVMVYPYGERARVRGVQSHDRGAESVFAGMRAALNLAGLGKRGVARGCTVAKAESMTLTSRADVQITMLKDAAFPLKSGTRAHFYHDTHELLCKVRLLDADVLEAGKGGFAQLLFDEPFAAKVGDHFVL